jgi:hypothetical protein
MVGVIFVCVAGVVHPFGHGELDDEFVPGSGHLSSFVPRDFAVLFVPRVETQHLFLSTRIGTVEPILPLFALWGSERAQSDRLAGKTECSGQAPNNHRILGAVVAKLVFLVVGCCAVRLDWIFVSSASKGPFLLSS